MVSGKKVLYICPFGNAEAREFAESLARELSGWNIVIRESTLGAFLFEIPKYDIAHFFLPAAATKVQRLMRKGSRTKVLQTLITIPGPSETYKRSIFADAVVTFSEQEKKEILQQLPDAKVHVIPPGVSLQRLENLEAPQKIREHYQVQDRLLVVALNDFRDQSQFSTFLYTVREYQRRGGFRFLIPVYHRDRQSLLWRNKLQNAILQEQLTATTLLETEVDLHSLIDAADIALLTSKNTDRPFGFPLRAIEALCAGKPVITYNVPPVHEIIAQFQEGWLVKAYEDFSRISRDLLKQVAGLEHLSTELARFARARLSVESVAQRHINLYNSLLSL